MGVLIMGPVARIGWVCWVGVVTLTEGTYIG